MLLNEPAVATNRSTTSVRLYGVPEAREGAAKRCGFVLLRNTDNELSVPPPATESRPLVRVCHAALENGGSDGGF